MRFTRVSRTGPALSAVTLNRRTRPAIAGAAACLLGLALTCLPGTASAQQHLDGGGASPNSQTRSYGDPTNGYLDGGGPARRVPTRRGHHRSQDGFLSDGGSVETAPDIVIDGRRDNRFLDQGGSITVTPDLSFTDEDEEFLEDGGSVRSRPGIVIHGRDHRSEAPYPLRPLGHSRQGFTTDGSFGFVSAGRGRVGDRAFLGSPLPPRAIDVATRRLDRRKMPGSGIETIVAGGAKIIRIVPGYGAGTRTSRK